MIQPFQQSRDSFLGRQRLTEQSAHQETALFYDDFCASRIFCNEVKILISQNLTCVLFVMQVLQTSSSSHSCRRFVK